MRSHLFFQILCLLGLGSVPALGQPYPAPLPLVTTPADSLSPYAQAQMYSLLIQARKAPSAT